MKLVELDLEVTSPCKMDPDSCFVEDNRQEVLMWKCVADLLKTIVALQPPSIVMPNTYVTKVATFCQHFMCCVRLLILNIATCWLICGSIR